MKGKKPERRCVGCWSRKDKGELVRLVASDDGGLVVDVEHKLEGRGMYLCPRRECMKKVVRKDRISKALRRRIEGVTPEALETLIYEAHKERFFSLLHFCRKVGCLITGREAVRKELKRGRVSLLILAKDLSDRSKRAFHCPMVPWVEVGRLKEYGEAFSTKPLGVLAVTEAGLARRLFFVAEKLRQIEEG